MNLCPEISLGTLFFVIPVCISFPFFQILFSSCPSAHVIATDQLLYEQRRRLDALGHFVSFPLARSDFRVRRRTCLPATRATTATLATRPTTATLTIIATTATRATLASEQAGKDRSPPPDILARCTSREARCAFDG